MRGIYKSMKSGINERGNRIVPLSWENFGQIDETFLR